MFKRLKISVYLLLFIFLKTEVKAQQEQSFTHFMFHPTVYNPAVNGNLPYIQLTGLIRQQWIGLSGAPETFFMNIHAPISLLHGGAGLTILNDQIGPFNSTGLKLAYAYRTNFRQGELSLGLSVGLINKSINYSYFNVQDDPLLAGSSDESGMIFNLDVGLFYQVKDQYYIGLSSTQLNQGQMTLEGGISSLTRNYYLHGGYYFSLRQLPKVVFHPNAMFAYTLASPIQINFGITAEYNKKFWGGVTYRYQSAIGLLAGLYYKQFSVGYGYEINITPLKNGGSHELMVGYRFLIEIEKGNKSYKNTRYL